VRLSAPAVLAVLAALVAPPSAGAGRAQAGGLLEFSEGERAVIAAHGPWPPAAQRDASNRLDGRRAAIAYGRRLFFDPLLSRDGRTRCATCHVPDRAFQDGLPVARGRGAGVRNTPSLLDVADRRWFGWGGAHDSLWSASLAPLLDAREMDNEPAGLAAATRADRRRRAAYEAGIGTPPPADDERLLIDLAKALAAYQATLRSPRTPFDAFRDALLRGDRRAAARYPVAAQRGLRLFIGKARCSTCHAGPAFTNDEFGDIGMAFFIPGGVDAGRHAGVASLRASRTNRLGPHNDAGADDERAVLTRHVQVEHRHFGEFRVPGLRQLAQTAPYMHDGSLATLEEVVRHYSELNEERLHADGERILRRLNLDPGEAADLAAFLRSLSK
jgi:cytochrome c peroxidase